MVYADGRLYRAGRATADKGVPRGRLSIYDADDGTRRAGVSFDYTPRPPDVDGGSVYVRGLSTLAVVGDTLYAGTSEGLVALRKP